MPYSQAITTCARAAEYRPPPQLGIHLNKDKDVGSEVKLLPEELFVALECCLDDLSDQVKRAAAITLYTLERPIPKVIFQLLQSHPDSQIVYVFVFSLCLCTSLSLYIFVFVHLCLCTSLSLYIFVFVHLCLCTSLSLYIFVFAQISTRFGPGVLPIVILNICKVYIWVYSLNNPFQCKRWSSYVSGFIYRNHQH